MLFNRKKKEQKDSAIGTVLSMFNVGQPVWSGRDYKSFAQEGYVQNVVVNRCVDIISKGVASIDWQVFTSNGIQEIEKHPLLDLLHNPNERQASCDFFEAVAAYKLLSGNSYIEAAYANSENTKPSKQKPVYLYTHRPDRMKIIKGGKGRVAAYRYEIEGQSVEWPVSVGGISNILHIKSFNPVDDWYGLSNVESGAYAIDQHNAASAWNQSLLQNGARPNGALMYKSDKSGNELSDTQFNRLKDEIEEKYTGTKNAGKPLLLEGGLEWKEMSMNPKDMDWLDGKHSVARDVALAFGVPSQLLGIPGDSTYNNMQEARLALWEQTILPLVDEITAHLNRWLVPRFGDDLYLTYSKESIDALRIKREMQRSSLEKVSFMTINEKREAIGLEKIDGGDEILIDSNKIPVAMVNDVNITPQQQEDVGQKLYIKTLKDLGYSEEDVRDALT